MDEIQKANPPLKDTLRKNLFVTLGADKEKLKSLINDIDDIRQEKFQCEDLIGRTYEYFLRLYAASGTKEDGEFYTPSCVVQLIAELIEPYSGVVYDPCCGSGGMFVQSMKFVDRHKGNRNRISVIGQESIPDTWRLCKMNLAIRGIAHDLGVIVDNSFIMPSKDIILTAKWEKTHYAVTLDGETQYIRVGESIVLPSLTRRGYIFNGWRYGGELYHGSYVPKDDMTFTSDWEAVKYTVTLNPNGGSLTQSTATVTYSSVFQLPIPTKEGYEFVGWYTSTGRSGSQETNKQGASVSVWDHTSSMTLYAIWTKDYEMKLKRESCRAGNGYDPSESGSDVDLLAHHDWDILSLVIGGCVQEEDGDYFIPEGNLLSVSFKVLQNLGALPTWGMNGVSVNWGKHWLDWDSYSGAVYGTNLNNQAIGDGAYYVKIIYTDGATYETNKVDFMSGASKNDIINVSLNLNVNKRIRSLEVVAVYELFYDYMSRPLNFTGTQCIANWRCSGTINFG